MAIDVRTVNADEFPAWVEAMRVGFLGHSDDGEAERRLVDTDLSRVWGAFDGSRIVGTLRSWACELTVPGGAAVTTAALTNVTVTPTHRRQGLASRMLEPDLRAAADRGEVAGILIAAEYPIYGRFGYGPAVDRAALTVDAAMATFPGPRSGSVELIDLATLRVEGPPLYEQVRARHPGAITRPDKWWDDVCQVVTLPKDEPYKGFVVLGRDETGRPDGYVRYTIDTTWEDFRPRATLSIAELVAVTPAAYERLWRYCCEIDWVRTVKAEDRPLNEPLRWLLADGRMVVLSDAADFLWVRPLDVTGLLSARTYLVEGRFVIEVVDPSGFANGRYAVEGGRDGATCKPTNESPGLTLPVEVLGALCLGGQRARSIALTGRIDVHDDAALATADAMLQSEVPPWCSTWF